MLNKKYILILNAGSSSIKFCLYELDELNLITQGMCERINVDGRFKMESPNFNINETHSFPNHIVAIEFLLNQLLLSKIIIDFRDIILIGHRIVQGAEISESKLIDDLVLKIIKDAIQLAPLHNKPQCDVIEIMKDKLSHAMNVAVFDTSFHTTIPKLHSFYAIPKDWIEDYKIKRYGFHGTSYKYILNEFKKIVLKDNVNIVVCHLGNGASVCCIKNNKSYDTSMGLTPNAGLIMGTRSGDIDATIIGYISNQTNCSIDEIIKRLNNDSGLKGICGSSDYRDINANIKNGNDFDFANKIFSKKVSDYIIQYMNYIGDEIDGIIFTGGIGENNYQTRTNILDNIKLKKIVINEKLNESKFDSWKKISDSQSEIPVFVIKTNEEFMIANDAKKIYLDKMNYEKKSSKIS